MFAKYISMALVVGAVAGAALWSTARPEAQGNRKNYPTTNLTNPNLQVTQQLGTGPAPQIGNNQRIYLIAQLAPNIDYHSVALSLGDFSFTPAAQSQPFTETCGLTNGDTMLECTLAPSGPTWTAGGPVMTRVEVASADGKIVGTALVQAPIR